MPQKKILLVEDDNMISTMYKTKLEQAGYQVIVAADGAAALEQASTHSPSLIFLDIILPQLDGFTVLQELRLNPKFKEVPIIMLTNLGTSEDKDKGDKFGATDYLVKANLTPREVNETAEKYLGKAESPKKEEAKAEEVKEEKQAEGQEK